MGRVIDKRPFMGEIVYTVQFQTPAGMRKAKFFEREIDFVTGGFSENPPPGYSGPRVLRPKHGSGGMVDALHRQPKTRGGAAPVRPMKTKKAKIPIAKFERWLKNNGSREEVQRYQREKQAYKRFHKGAEPTHITRRLVDVGAGPKVVGRSFAYSMGKSPFEPYITPKGSGKGAAKPYLHEYETMPEGITTSRGKTVIKPLDGRTKITDWIHY